MGKNKEQIIFSFNYDTKNHCFSKYVFLNYSVWGELHNFIFQSKDIIWKICISLKYLFIKRKTILFQLKIKCNKGSTQSLSSPSSYKYSLIPKFVCSYLFYPQLCPRVYVLHCTQSHTATQILCATIFYNYFVLYQECQNPPPPFCLRLAFFQGCYPHFKYF